MTTDLADRAGLKYVDTTTTGYRRVRRGRGFSYLGEEGNLVDGATKEWIKSLVIPPAWTDVWISPYRSGHILATGLDNAGRKQYIYHPQWEEVRDEVKFERLGDFGDRLPGLRRRVHQDLKPRELTRDKVVAVAVAVLDRTLVRVGNPRYVLENDSYGLTTLTCDHIEIDGRHVHLEFTAKGQSDTRVAFSDSRLARLISECQELAGQTLFSYESSTGETASVQSTDINSYLRDTTGVDFTAKDFRTWGASSLVVAELGWHDETENGGRMRAAIEVAAERLGNTPEVCRSSYVHPVIEDALTDGSFGDIWRRARSGKWVERSESALRLLLDDRGGRCEGGVRHR